MTKALFPGSFDPVTFGHLDVIKRAASIFDEIVVAVAINTSKKSIFTVPERIEMLRILTEDIGNISVSSFRGVTVDYMREIGIKALLRGMRTFSDFEYEAALANANRRLAPEIETVFIMSGTEYSFVSSRLIRELAVLEGKIGTFLPQLVADRLMAKVKEQNSDS